MSSCVRTFGEIDRGQVAAVGGKGANLGELGRIEGIHVPAGFCVTTEAFDQVVTRDRRIADRIDRLSGLQPGDPQGTAAAAEVRAAIDAVAIPDDLAAAIAGAVAALGQGSAVAVRSSATAEDLPTASFAGQHDTYLNLTGSDAVIGHVRRCWASLYTDRAVTYRVRNGIDHQQVRMAVVVQQLVAPQASGILFTADPVSGNRRVATVEAGFGLGEALVSGLVEPDTYTVRDGEVIAEAIGAKQLATRAVASGGTEEQSTDTAQQDQAALTRAQVLELVALGRRIEAHFGHPQDIEWCLVDGGFQVVQSRPITTLFPIPPSDDGENHVYVSVGHQQMMTDPMKPLGLSVWQLTAPRPMHIAGGRLFVDVTGLLASPATRPGTVHGLGTSDPLIGDALQTIVDRDGFLPAPVDDPAAPPVGPPLGGPSEPIATDPAIVADLIALTQASIAAVAREIRTKQGPELIDFIEADLVSRRAEMFASQNMAAIMAGMEATWWLNDHLGEWLGERSATDTLTQSVPHNITSQMGLDLLDVADAVRPHPDVVAVLERAERTDDDTFLDELPGLPGGTGARDAIVAFLSRYGMRCVGEIDISRPRWSERPTLLVPVILVNVRTFEAGEGGRRFERGLEEARAKELDVLARLRAQPDGERKAEETKAMIDRVRTFAGYREYPKYGLVSRYAVYRKALLEEAGRLVDAGLVPAAEDISYLSIPELRTVAAGTPVDDGLLADRKEAFASYARLSAPRVLTSDGEAVPGRYRRDDVPEGALVGLAVSAGTIEGRARVVHDIGDADLDPGDILVTPYTDPSWSALFVAVAGLVTEVGGLMTHGAVIAREYGLPAVVGVERATERIRDGQRIRVHGSDGFVELLP
ncbi:rifamycin-inactivating phosphotransferase [Aquihabitans sp. McL0605]|uniref:rifamycin-inactivating phosphotransferase n=1 Tax=Aquihabitans sp. McL0605 TaxID=3415671 RepID=UPI003CF8F124